MTVFIPEWRPAAELKRNMLAKLEKAGMAIQEVRHDHGFQFLWIVYRKKDGKIVTSGPDCFDVMADACQFIDAQEALVGRQIE